MAAADACVEQEEYKGEEESSIYLLQIQRFHTREWKERQMGSESKFTSSIWEEIERSESLSMDCGYLVCCMYEKAAYLASSVLKQIRNLDGIEFEFDYDVQEMEESAAMILVQSLNQLGRIVTMQASSLKKAFVDFWHLAFSYQVNPLAAVQPLPPAIRGNN